MFERVDTINIIYMLNDMFFKYVFFKLTTTQEKY